MTHPQLALAAILAAAALLIALQRWRYDVVAALALVAAVLAGAVPAERMFDGFADPVVATIALLAVLGAAVRDSGLVEAMVAPLTPVLRWGVARMVVLGGIGGTLAAAMGGAPVLAAMLPAVRRRTPRDERPVLLPIAAVAMMGALCCQVGTVPNLLAAAMRRQVEGTPFGLFDFAAVGVPVALAGLLALAVAWRFVAPESTAAPEVGHVESYTSEVVVPAGSPLAGQRLHAMEAWSGVGVKAIIREGFRRIDSRPDWVVEAGDVLVLDSELQQLQRLMQQAGLHIVGAQAGLDPERIGVVEAVVTPASDLVGRSPRDGFGRRPVSLLAIGRSGRQPGTRLHRTKLQPGDVLVLQGELSSLPGTLAGMGCLTLTERRLRLGRPRQILAPALLLVVALGLAASGTLPLALALLAAVLVLAVLRSVTLDEIYAAVPWPLIVLVGAMLPLGLALHDSGTADILAGGLSRGLAWLPSAAPAVALLVALLASPFLTGPFTLLVLAPIALSLAARLGSGPDAVLMALALGASWDGMARLLGAEPGRTRRLLIPVLMAVMLLVGGAAVHLVWAP